MNTKKTHSAAMRVARLAVLVSIALVLAYVERLIPAPIPVPGVKLGLANLAVLVALYLFGWRDALTVSALRVLLSGALFGGGFSMIYALCGAVSSFAAMALLKRLSKLHVATISAVGGLLHNMAQLCVAACVVSTKELYYYAPALAISGILTGICVGLMAAALIPRLEKLHLT